MKLGPIVCDACVVLNLLATGQEVRLVRALGAAILMAPLAHGETRFLYGSPDEAGNPGIIPANLQALEKAGLLEVRPIGEPGSRLHENFVHVARVTSQADAESMAVASALELPLATDDRKQRRIFSTLFGGPLLSTLELIRETARVLKLANHEVRAMLAQLFEKGRFAPPREGSDLPHGEWYRGHLEAARVLQPAKEPDAPVTSSGRKGGPSPRKRRAKG